MKTIIRYIARPLRSAALKQAALIDSALEVVQLPRVLVEGAPLDVLMFGGAERGDLMNNLGCDWSPEGMEMMDARQQFLLCARAYKLLAVDGGYHRINDLEGLKADESER